MCLIRNGRIDYHHRTIRTNQSGTASLGERILARIIDYFLLFIYILATSYILGKLNIHAFSGSTFFLLFLFIYLPVLCYSLLCEVFNQGQSAGKKLMNIRVVKADGTTPSLSAIC